MTTVKRIIGALVALVLAATLAGCYSPSEEVQQRKEAAKESVNKDSLEKQNLRRKLELEADPNRTGYVYLLSSTGQPIGYYVIKGKVSSSGSQIEPEDYVDCPYTTSAENCNVIDGPQDDGTFGEGDPGVFFFLADGTMIETDTVHLYATKPIASAIKVPQLG